MNGMNLIYLFIPETKKIFSPLTMKFENMKNSERITKALEYQRNGEIDKAIQLYEMNVQLKDEAPASYNRLITIYSRRKDIENELRILKAYLNIATKRANEASERSKEKKMEIVDFIKNRINKLRF
jgi:hypothetical protein